MDNCSKCGGALTQRDAMDSGNATFVTYSCSSCGSTVTKCVGLNPEGARY